MFMDPKQILEFLQENGTFDKLMKKVSTELENKVFFK